MTMADSEILPSHSTQQHTAEPIEELRRQYQALRTTFHAVLITLIVLSGSLTFFLWRQVALLGRQWLPPVPSPVRWPVTMTGSTVR